jgi:hypothetical protein
MAGEEAALKGNALQRWSSLVSGRIERLTTPRGRTIALTLFFFLLTLLVYRLTSQGPPAANMPLRLADAFLHGRLDIANGEQLPWLDWAFYEGKYYMLEPPITALVVLPGVFLYGLDLDQTVVSIVIGSLTAAVMFLLMRGLTEEFSVQVWLTLLLVFGTIYWWNAVNGATWYFAHAVSMLFLLLAVYETLVGKRPFTAGLFLGAAYLARLPTILAFPFFLIMFSDRWWRPKPETEEMSPRGWTDVKPMFLRLQRVSGVWLLLFFSFLYTDLKPLLFLVLLVSGVWGLIFLGFVYKLLIYVYNNRQRIDLKPLLQLGLGVGIFVLLSFAYNYLRFEDPLNTGYSVWRDYLGSDLDYLLPEGLFDISYVGRNIPVMIQAVPVFPSEAPYVYSSMSGMAIWATTPAFLYALFAGVRNRVVLVAGTVMLIVAVAVLLFAARGLSWFGLAYTPDYVFQIRLSGLDFLYDLSIVPFLFLVAYGVFVGLRGNKLVLACWSAILPIAAVHFVYPIQGWPQFGYRYALDYYPFLLLLVLVAIGNKIRWHHKILIAASIAINLVGILWWYEFEPRGLGGITWVFW